MKGLKFLDLTALIVVHFTEPIPNMYKQQPTLVIKGYTLILSCGACPEQYEVFKGDTRVGYLRLRHGRFTAEYPDVGWKLLLSAYPQGDGMFDEQERLYWLTKAVLAIDAEHTASLRLAVAGLVTQLKASQELARELDDEIFALEDKLMDLKDYW